uniref:Uncharacterized protein n=1 Tax=Candidatus Kentrum sp. SD TaxID=2126332 RepID=A0A450YC27_9GAMM|nr:MAG: hypothetical protein BECKSD772F_GA0070984_10029 [Candidatus Kentron sp. SD]VFK39100.1 MAG: hypothetical protein BECKSD772E_GA0070983_10029 [Candidatus Kentron sp. SD]
MTDNANLVQIYTDHAEKHITMMRQQGKVIAFAMGDKRRIHHTMQDASSQDGKRAFSRKVDPHPVR